MFQTGCQRRASPPWVCGQRKPSGSCWKAHDHGIWLSRGMTAVQLTRACVRPYDLFDCFCGRFDSFSLASPDYHGVSTDCAPTLCSPSWRTVLCRLKVEIHSVHPVKARNVTCLGPSGSFSNAGYLVQSDDPSLATGTVSIRTYGHQAIPTGSRPGVTRQPIRPPARVFNG